MRVKAKRLGYYGNKRRYPGDVFTLVPYTKKDGTKVSAEEQFSKHWHEKLADQNTPEVSNPKPRIGRETLDEVTERNHVDHPGEQTIMQQQKESAEKIEETSTDQNDTEQSTTEEKPKSSGDVDLI